MISGKSKACTTVMNMKIATDKTPGATSGNVMRRAMTAPLAPCTVAACSSCGSILRIRPLTITNAVGTTASAVIITSDHKE